MEREFYEEILRLGIYSALIQHGLDMVLLMDTSLR